VAVLAPVVPRIAAGGEVAAAAEEPPRGSRRSGERRTQGIGERADVRVARATEPPPPLGPKMEVSLSWLPASASLMVDGKKVSDGLRAVWTDQLHVGSIHEIRVSDEACCFTWEGDLEVTENGIELKKRSDDSPQASPWTGRFARRIFLKPKPAFISVDADPETALVYQGGRYQGSVREVDERGGFYLNFSTSDPTETRYVKPVEITVLPPPGQDTLFPARRKVVEVTAGSRPRVSVVLGGPP
jgi:hypothetical protein